MFHLSPRTRHPEAGTSVHWLPLRLFQTTVLSHFSAAQGTGWGTWQDHGDHAERGLVVQGALLLEAHTSEFPPVPIQG